MSCNLDGIKGNFYISEIEYLATAIFQEKSKLSLQIIYSNVKECVIQQRSDLLASKILVPVWIQGDFA